jgi:hypothetical protein
VSPIALQRLVVRCLYDPALVDRVYSGAPVPGLDAEARGHITRVDRRAWGTDPYRRARTLHALLDEFPASAAGLGIAGLDTFFGAPAFHAAVDAGTSLALAFGGWIGPRAGDIGEIERALARVRRAPPTPLPPPGHVARPANLAPLAVVAGTCARWEDLRAALGPDPVARLVAGFRAPPWRAGRGREHLLVAHGEGGDTVGYGADGLHALLVAAASPRPRAQLQNVAVRAGATSAEAHTLLDELVSEGLLLEGPRTRVG